MTKLRNDQAGVAHVAALMAAVLIVAIGGVGWSVYNNSKDKQSNSINDSSEVETADTLPTGFVPQITLDKVKQIAAEQAPNQNVLGIELEVEEGKVVYTVRLADGSKLLVNATDGTLVTKLAAGQKDDANEDESDEKLPANVTTKVSALDARTAAEAKMPGKTVKGVELESEDGKLVWKVRFTDGSRVVLDANTGTVVTTRTGDSKSGSSNKSSSSGSSNTTKTNSTSGSGSSNTTTQSGSQSSDDSSTNDDSSTHDATDDDSGSHSGSGSGSGGSGSGSGGSHDSNDD